MPRPGDFAIWLMGRSYSHGAIVAQWPVIIHAFARMGAVVDWRVERVERAWAGLRSFAPDRLPVYGYDPERAGFFWFAGQGGFGIQTAPAAAKLGAALLRKVGPDPMISGIDAARTAPDRFSR